MISDLSWRFSDTLMAPLTPPTEPTTSVTTCIGVRREGGGRIAYYTGVHTEFFTGVGDTSQNFDVI